MARRNFRANPLFYSFAMSLRTVDHFRTIDKILAHNDKLLRENSGGNTQETPSFSISPGSIFEISNMEAIFNNNRSLNSLLIYIVFMVSQLIINYIGFIVLDIEKKPVVLTMSQIYNIFGSYFFPLVLAAQVEENISNPFHDLNREAAVYRNFRLSAIIQTIGLILSVWATIEVFTKGPYIKQELNFPELGTREVDITGFVRVYQLITMQIVICTLVLSLVNLYITDRRLVNYFNRIESTQNKNDLEGMFHSVQIPDDMYEKDLKTYYRNGESYHGFLCN